MGLSPPVGVSNCPTSGHTGPSLMAGDALDRFLHRGNRMADHLADYLQAAGRDHPQPPHEARYDASITV